MKTAKFFVPVLLGVVLSVSSTTVAQCGGDDGFRNGPCCVPANPTLPIFPTCQVAGRGGTFRDCSLEAQYPTGNLITPVQVLCDYWLMTFNVTSTNWALNNQTVVAKYDRTWREFPTAASPSQVWRFLINTDAVYTINAVAAIGPEVPLSAAAPYNLPVHMFGHIDFVMNCATGSWTCSYSLSHLCPTDMYAAFSARPIPASVAWPRRTYHLVAPQNFNFTAICAAPQGPIFADAERHSTLIPGFPYTCHNESQIASGFLQTVAQNCDCFTPGGFIPPNRNVHQTLQFGLNCGTASVGGSTIPIPPILPTGLRGTVVGTWQNPAGALTYPGNECLTVYLGVLSFNAPCPSPIPPAPFHAVCGVGTVGGYNYALFGSPVVAGVVPQFLDLENMLIIGSPLVPPFTPGLGALFASDEVWSFNM